MKIPGQKPKSGDKNKITKEVFIGLLAIVLGAYNLLSGFGVITVFVEVPQLIGSILLILTGLFLWLTAYKLFRHRYHTRSLF